MGTRRYGSSMTQQEFLTELRRSLSGRLPAGEVDEHVNYYADYIDMQRKKGTSEEQVIAELGDPRLIAKSILSAAAGSKRSDQTVYSTDRGTFTRTNHDRHFRSRAEKAASRVSRGLSLKTVLIVALIVLIITFALILALVAAVVRFVLPILGILLLGWLILEIVRAVRR